MTKVHHTKYKPRYKQYILDQITDDGWDNPLTDRREKIAHIITAFTMSMGTKYRAKESPRRLLSGYLAWLCPSLPITVK